ncbi:hypothetical protein [Flavitalea sp.]|nr:hypothetical protein [Flavitalea sp.]
MKRFFHIIVFTSLIVLSACSTSKEPTGVWVNKEKAQGKSYGNIFVVVMSADIEARAKLENDLATEVTSRGFKAVKSVDAMPPSLSDPKKPTKEEIVKTVKESGCDAVLVGALLKQEEAVKYNPQTTKGTLTTYYSYTNYYSNSYSSVHTPSYYSQDKSYYMQTNFYDAASEELMWAVQSTIFNPSSIAKFSKTYTSTLISQLQKEKILK